MATSYVTYNNGKIEVSEDLQDELQLHNGEQLPVVMEQGRRVIVMPTRKTRTGVTDWSVFEGVLGGLGLDLNADLEAERLRENE